jgi:predicted 3-demethylubiquinone-9 3-methyltransferase (glyoxalase superfamily)
MQKISPFLWFNSNAEEAVNFYASIFKDLQITNTMRNGENGPGPAGSVLTMGFQLFGQHFTILNGGPGFATLTPAISFVVRCENQEEVDHYWDNLLQGGKAMQCGWLTDKYGVTWQIIPVQLFKLMGDKNPVKAKKVTEAMMKMVKLDIAGLERAYNEA